MKKMVNQTYETIKKHDKIFVFIYFVLITSIYIFIVKLDVSDELWNFSFLHRFVNNYDLYRDLNVIITPLFYYIGKILFLIFGDNFISFRIYNILIFSSLYLTIYVLFRKLKIQKIDSFFIVLVLSTIITTSFITAGASYNVLAIIFVLIGICLELDEKNTFSQNILKGIIIFCIFMIKQNIFVYYAIALAIHYLIKIKLKKITIKEICITGFTFISFISVFLLYLLINNTFNYFISNCFLGISEFAQNNFKIKAVEPVVIIDIIIVLFNVIIILNKKIKDEIRKTNLLIIPFSIFMLFIAYPIFNSYHLFFASLVTFIICIYNWNYIIYEINSLKKIMKNITKFYIVVITISYIILNIAYFIMYQKSEDMISKMYPYNNILMGEEVRNDINDVCEYIKENEKQNINVEIISHRAFLYMNILNKSNKDFDFPLLGNLGKDGENKLISKVENLKSGTQILISKEKFWQESDKLLNKIKNEYKYIGEIGNLYIYEK